MKVKDPHKLQKLDLARAGLQAVESLAENGQYHLWTVVHECTCTHCQIAMLRTGFLTLLDILYDQDE